MLMLEETTLVPLARLGSCYPRFFLDTYTMLTLKLLGNFLSGHFLFGVGGARGTQSSAILQGFGGCRWPTSRGWPATRSDTLVENF